MCFINRDCKIKPIKDYYKERCKKYDIVEYIGIAVDEPIRLQRMKKGQISLLEKYRYTEKMAFDLCNDCELLSPIYENGTRGGCWFCPNSKLLQFIQIRKKHPQMWEELRELSKTPNLCSYGFKYGKTLQQVEKEMDAKEINNKLQLSLF